MRGCGIPGMLGAGDLAAALGIEDVPRCAGFVDRECQALEGVEEMMVALGMDEETFQRHLQLLRRAFEFKGYIPLAETRGVNVDQLQSIIDFATASCDQWVDVPSGLPLQMHKLNFYQLNAWCIKPATYLDNCAFVELLSGLPQNPTWFCCHWWGEDLLSFVSCIEMHLRIRGLPRSMNYWVGALSNRQHPLSNDLDLNPEEMSIFKAMRRASGMLLFLDDEAHAFSRIWCTYEEFIAITIRNELNKQVLLDIAAKTASHETKLLVDGLTEAEKTLGVDLGGTLKRFREMSFPLELLQKGLHRTIEDATASDEMDRTRILNKIACLDDLTEQPLKSHENYDYVNRVLAARVAEAAWAHATMLGRSELLGLPNMLKENPSAEQQCLVFDFGTATCREASDIDLAVSYEVPAKLLGLELLCGHCERITDAGLAVVGKKLPEALRKLTLDFTDCLKVTDHGVVALVANLPGVLEELTLLLGGCDAMTDNSLFVVASKLPSGLLKLCLDLGHAACSATRGVQITDVGISAICSKLPATLLGLQLSLSGDRITDRGLLAIGNQIPSTLQELTLVFSGCCCITDVGVGALSSRLPKLIKRLQLAFIRCGEITDAGVAALAANLPRRLRELFLGFAGLTGITDVGVAAVGAKLPKELLKLALDFSGCLKITSAGVSAVVAKLPSTLRELALNLQGCQQVGDTGVAAVGAKIPSGLQALRLNLHDCERITPQGMNACKTIDGLSAFAHSHSASVFQVAFRYVVLCQLKFLPAPPIRRSLCAVADLVPQSTPRAAEPVDSMSGIGVWNSRMRITLRVVGSYWSRPAFQGCLLLALSQCSGLRELSLHFSGLETTDSRLVVLSVLPISLLTLRLDLKDCANITDAAVAIVGANLPDTLRRFMLNVTRCKKITDSGVCAAVRKLPSELESLELFFGNCHAITDGGLAAVGANLPSSLSKLELGFFGCVEITDNGVSLLAEKLPSTLCRLTLDFSACSGLTDGAISIVGASLPSTLEKLALEFNYCPKMTHPDMSRNLPVSLLELTLSFSGCPHVRLELTLDRSPFPPKTGSPGHSSAKPPSVLQDLTLLFNACSEITDEMVASVVSQLPTSLLRLRLNFSSCHQLTDVCVEALSANLPSALMELTLSIMDCPEITDDGVACLGASLPVTLDKLKVSVTRGEGSKLTHLGLKACASKESLAEFARRRSQGS